MVQFLVPIQLNRCTKSKDFWDADVFCLRLFTLSASNPMNLLSACPSWAEYYNPPCQSAGALGAILLFTLAVAFLDETLLRIREWAIVRVDCGLPAHGFGLQCDAGCRFGSVPLPAPRTGWLAPAGPRCQHHQVNYRMLSS
jgi:hypothetical protein